MKKKIKLFIKKLLDKSILKQENKELCKKIEDYENERKKLIDLKNKYLSDLRCKNLELGRIKKQIEKI